MVGGVLEANQRWDIGREVMDFISKEYPGALPIRPKVRIESLVQVASTNIIHIFMFEVQSSSFWPLYWQKLSHVLATNISRVEIKRRCKMPKLLFSNKYQS